MYLLNMNEEVRKALPPAPMDLFRYLRKLSSYLVRSKLYSLQRRIAS